MPKILIVQDHLHAGGAARAAGRWAPLLAQAGHTVMQVAGDEKPGSGFVLTGKPTRGWGRIREIFTGGAGRKAAVEIRFGEILFQTKPDLIWFHNLAGGGKWGWSEEMIKIAREHAPTLWTLHDMWALGDGSESYWKEGSVVESGRWKGTNGGKQEEAGSGRVEGLNGLKAEGVRESRTQRVCGWTGKFPIMLTAPSKWLAELTQKMTGFECVHLPNPIDLDIFSPGDQAEARRQLGLPEKGLMILAGADSLQDPRKGFDLLMAAWQQLHPESVTLALYGRHGKAQARQVYLGNLNSDEQLVAAYRAADLYVHPARMENAPCTIQESLACGTPVLAFPTGGIPEMIINGKHGFLAKETTEESLKAALASALKHGSDLWKMRGECRGRAEEIWRPDGLTQKYLGVVGGL